MRGEEQTKVTEVSALYLGATAQHPFCLLTVHCTNALSPDRLTPDLWWLSNRVALSLCCRTIKYLYDGECPMCMSLKTVLKRQDNERGIIKFVNLADASYKPKNNMGIT